jgi:hypothetical protein
MEISSANIGGNIVTVIASPVLKLQAAWLLDVLRNTFDQGAKIDDGSRLQIGWSVLTLRKQADGSLTVCEPDFARNPFQDEIKSVDVTLQVLGGQNRFAARVGVVPVMTSFQDKIVIAKGALDAISLYMERRAPSPEKGDSGWYIGGRDRSQGTKELEAIYAFQLLKLRPELVETLVLPPGYMAFIEGREISSILNANNEPVSLKPV